MNVKNFSYIEQFTGITPDMKEIVRIGKARGVEIEEQQIDTRLQNLFQQELLMGNIEGVEKLEEQFDRSFTIKPGDLQVLYTQVLMPLHYAHCEPEIYQFLLERTGISPDPEIIQARYRSLFNLHFTSPSDVDSIGEFQNMVDVPPTNEMLQKKYRVIFEEYIKHQSNRWWNDDAQQYYEDHGDNYFAVYSELIRITGIQPQFDRDYIFKLYEFCVSSDSEYHPKLGTIFQETGVTIDQEFIQKYILDNPKFSSPVHLSISHDQLDQHFTNLQNTSPAEYTRIYRIFGCFDYYQNLLAKLEQDKSRGAKQRIIAILAVMGLRDMENEEHYATTKAKLMSFMEEKSTPINKSLGEALAELAKNGDADLLSYLASTLRERTKSTKGEERGVMGFSPIQEVSLRTLFYVDNPVANEHLLALLSVSDIDPRVRMYILKKSLAEKPEFFPAHMQDWASAELSDKKSTFPWEDLRYLQATNQIPSADLRRKSIKYLNDAFEDFFEYPNLHPSDIQKDTCPSVPDNIFLPLWKCTRGDPALLEKFNGLYKATKASAQKDALMFGIVNALSINKKTLGKVIDRLGEIDLVAPGSAEVLGTVLKTLSFLDTVERELGQSREETLTILDSSVESLSSLNESLKQVAVQKIKKVLPHEEINIDAIQSLWKRWGSLEPIFVYAGKMASSNHDGTLRLVAEMVANMDAPEYEGWKCWRYNREDRKVQEQIGHLTQAQLEVWKGDHFAELGDIMIAATPSDKPKQISRFIEGSLREGHIYNSQIHTSDRHKFIQERLGAAYAAISEHPDQRETILNGAAESLQVDIEKIDAIIRFSNLPKLEQALALFSEGKNVPVNAKTKNSIGFLAQFLPKEQFQEIERVYKEAEAKFDAEKDPEEKKKINVNGIVSKSAKDLLVAKIEEIKTKYEKVIGLQKQMRGFSNSDGVAFSRVERTVDARRVENITAFYNDNFPDSLRTVDRQLSKYTKDDSFEAMTLEQGGNLIGLLEVKRTTEGILLETIAIDKKYQGQGLSKKLFTELLKTVQRGTKIQLHFRDSKREQLERFYDGLGFINLAKDGIYKNGETKWRMEFTKNNEDNDSWDDFFEQYGLNKEQIKNIGQFYQKRQELKALLDLYRVSALDVKRIATNRISDRVDKKGETLTKVIEGLKTYFKDNPTFVQDIENIHAVVSQREDLGAKRRLAMIVTDSPQMLFQVGKYPIGNGACQNYEGDSDWNKALAGYIADAHIKAAYLIDLNKLPDGLRSEIESKGFEEVKETIPHQDLLEASIARAITKITKVSESSEPTLFIEPTYSSINKGDLTMDKYFNIFLELMVSEPMGIRLTRGGGSKTVRVPKSRNPSGQYEDCAAGNAGHAGMGIQTGSYTMSARFIDKFTPVTDADRKLAERISEG